MVYRILMFSYTIASLVHKFSLKSNSVLFRKLFCPLKLFQYQAFNHFDNLQIRFLSDKTYSNEIELANELLNLNELIKYHDNLYYNENNPVISDNEYDVMVRRALEIQNQNSNLVDLLQKANSVGHKIPNSATPVKHSQPMLSLENAFGSEELELKLQKMCDIIHKVSAVGDQVFESNNVDFVIEPKIDGLSLSVIYGIDLGKTSVHNLIAASKDEGIILEVIEASTRGDGSVGEDITHNLEYIKSIPSQLKVKINPTTLQYLQNVFFKPEISKLGLIEVRGEVYISKTDFKTLNDINSDNLKKAYQTSRNAASSILRTPRYDQAKMTESQALKVLKLRKLSFLAYSCHTLNQVSFLESHSDVALCMRDSNTLDIGADNKYSVGKSAGSEISSQYETLQYLSKLGYSIPQPIYVGKELNETLEKCKEFELDRRNWPFGADGVVVKVNNVSYQNLLGSGTRSPKWAIAYKFENDVAQTKLLAIEVQVGRTGVLTPVAILEPVKLGDVIISRATLHNEEEINRLSLKSGCSVFLKRSGDVIPKIIGRVDNMINGNASRGNFSLPKNCPSCGSPTERIAESSAVRCTGGAFYCNAQTIEQIRKAANVKGLADGKIKDLIDSGLVKNIADLFTLQETLEINSIENLKSKKPKKTKRKEALVNDNSTAELFSSKANVLIERDGWGIQSVANLLTSIEQAKEIPFHRFLYGLGIRNIGFETTKDIASAFGSFENFWNYLKHEVVRAVELQSNLNNTTESKEDVQDEIVDEIGERFYEIKGIGKVSVNSLLQFGHDPRVISMVEMLMKSMKIVSEEVSKTKSSIAIEDKSTDRPLTSNDSVIDNIAESTSSSIQRKEMNRNPIIGKKVVFTGKLMSITRAEAQRLCESMGGQFSDSLLQGTDILVVGGELVEGKIKSSKKLEKAKSMGVEIWDEVRWMELVPKASI